MDMESNVRSPHTKRFVIEDSYTKVTADGEPHEMMTLIAGLSGVVAAIFILIILVLLVACKKDRSDLECKECKSGLNSKQCLEKRNKSLSKTSSTTSRSSISTISLRTTSTIEPNTPTDFALINGNLKGNLNVAFENTEINLTNSMKPKKKMRWQDEVTVIDMQER